MKNLKLFEEFQNKNYSEYINKIIEFMDNKNIKYTDMYKSLKGITTSLYVYLVDKFPVSFSFVGNDVTIIIEKDGITDIMGAWDIDNEMNEVFDIIENL